MFSSLLRRGCMTALVTARTVQRRILAVPSAWRSYEPIKTFDTTPHAPAARRLRLCESQTLDCPHVHIPSKRQFFSSRLFADTLLFSLAHFFVLSPARQMRRSPILAVTLLHHFRKLHFLVMCPLTDPCSPRFVPPLRCFPTSLRAMHVCVVLCCSLTLLLRPAPQHCSSVLMLSL